MKVKATQFYSLLFAIVLFAQLYLPSFKANVFLQLFVIIIFFILEKKPTIPVFLLEKSKLPIAIFLLGMVGTLFYKYSYFNILKDIFHFIKPILGLAIGYLFYKKINSINNLIKVVVLVGFLSAIIHLITIFFFSNLDTVSGLREFGKDNFVEMFALFFLLFYKKFFGETLFKKQQNSNLIFIVLLLSNVLYLSRTMIVGAIIILISVYGYSKITVKTIKIISVMIISVGLLYTYLFSVKIDRSGNSLESFLYKVKIAPAEIFETHIDRENHKDLWDHWRGYEAKRAIALLNQNPHFYFFGAGYGSLVNLKFFAPLTDNYKDKGLKYISELHNGIPYILYKTGIIGLIIYLSFLISLYKIIYKKFSFETVFISSIGLFYLFSTITITGIYNTRDCVVFILGSLLYFYNSKSKALQHD